MEGQIRPEGQEVRVAEVDQEVRAASAAVIEAGSLVAWVTGAV